MKLQYKISLFMFLGLFVIGLIGATVLLQSQNNAHRAQFERSAIAITRVLADSLEHDMLMVEREHIADAVFKVTSRDFVNEVIIYSDTNRVYASGNISEIGKVVKDEDIERSLLTGETITRTEEKYGRNELCVIIPLENKPQCQSCHGTEKNYIGSIEIGLDTQPLTDHLEEQTMLLLLISGSMFIGLALVLSTVISRVLINPLSQLTTAARRIAGGDYSARSGVTTRDEVGEVSGTFNDMAQQVEDALKRSEEFSETVMKTISDGICIVNPDSFDIVAVNSMFLEQVGSLEEEVIGRKCYEVLHKNDLPCDEDGTHLVCPVLECVRTGQQVNVEHEHLPIDEKAMIVDVSASPVKNEKGETTQVVYIQRDITQRKEQEAREELLQHEYNISSRLASIGELAAGAAHEMNNPLTGIIGFSERLLRKSDDEDVNKYARRIHGEASRVSKIVGNLITFARHHRSEKKSEDIREILDKSLELRVYELQASNVEIDVQRASDLPRVFADFQQIQQVFLNIIINAEQSMTQANKGGKLTIKTSIIDGGVRVIFTNTGPEIPEEQINKLFDPFFTTKGDHGGTGLGLSICYGIMEDHRGKIYARNSEGGVSFYVELPLAPDEK